MIPPNHTLRILLVEDHVATASALAKTLLKQGFAVAPANSARAALEAARQQPFDLLITDIGLPQKNGWELFRELRRLQPHLLAIAVTGYAYPQDVQRSLDVGIQVHLTKPATIQQVLAAIERVFPDYAPGASVHRTPRREPPVATADGKAGPGRVKLIYLEDDPRDVELLQLTCAQHEPDCELTAVTSRAAFVAALQTGRFDGILSDSGVHDLFGADAVRLARRLAPTLPYVFLCGMMGDAKRADLLAAKPDGIFSKDRPEDVGLAIGLVRRMTAAPEASR
jgi:CheY-like chemotaxis protein